MPRFVACYSRYSGVGYRRLSGGTLMLVKKSLVVALLVFGGLSALGQNAPTNTTPPPAASPSKAATAGDSKSADTPAKPSSDTTAENTKSSINSNKIPSGSKLFVASMGGFENYVIAGIIKKKVP